MQSPDRKTRASAPIFSLPIQLAIASKKPEDMNAEELAAYKEWQEWQDAHKEERQRQEEEWKREREERKREQEHLAEEQKKWSEEYSRNLREADRKEREEAGTLEWFMRKVQYERKPIEIIRLNTTPENAEKYMLVAYNAEVVRRGTDMQTDINTNAAIQAVSRWLTTHTKPGLMLRGYIGVGKTTMMWAIRSVLRHLLNETMEIVDARHIAELGKKGSVEFDELAKKRLLGIDDLGTEPLVVKNYGNDISPIVELLARRYDGRRFTIITTNLTVKKGENGVEVDELQEVYGDRTFDRIKEMFNEMNYDGTMKSYRK